MKNHTEDPKHDKQRVLGCSTLRVLMTCHVPIDSSCARRLVVIPSARRVLIGGRTDMAVVALKIIVSNVNYDWW